MLRDDFQLVINDTSYSVTPPSSLTVTPDLGEPLRLSEDEIQRLGDVRALVGQLYENLNVEEFQMLQERRLLQEMESLKEELEPLERKRLEIVQQAEKRTTQLSWLGLGMMSVQFGILARLTWFEYSWDIMEPGELSSLSLLSANLCSNLFALLFAFERVVGLRQ